MPTRKRKEHKKLEENRKVHMSAELDADLAQWAAEIDRSVPYIIRVLLEWCVEERKTKKRVFPGI